MLKATQFNYQLNSIEIMASNEKVVSSDAQMVDGQVVNNDAQSANFDQVVGRGDEVSYIFFKTKMKC